METIAIQVDSETRQRLQQRAQAHGLALEEYLAETLRSLARAEWSDIVRSLAGAWGDDFPEPEELRRSLEVYSC